MASVAQHTARRETISIVVAAPRTGFVRQWDVPEWLGRAALVSALVFGIGSAVGTVIFARTAGIASRARALEGENESLRAQFARVDELERKLGELSAENAKMRLLAGVSAGEFAAVPMSLMLGQPVFLEPFRGPLSRGFQLDDGGDFHPGADISGSTGAMIRAAATGTVRRAGFDPIYGNHAVLGHEDGYETVYGHAETVLVHQGQSVQAGELIARVGSSGRSTAPHLHFEIRKDGVLLDPAKFIPAYGVVRVNR